MLECFSSTSTVHKRRTKKKKMNEEVVHENVVDKISHLPEPLLHHIFSFLDIKQAIHACILSKRWRYFWVSLPTLNFNCSREKGYLQIKGKSNFIDFVDRVLLLRDNSSNIQKLAVVVKPCYGITSSLDTWIRISVIHNIQELTLQFFAAKNIWEFPHCLSNCKSLTKLVLSLHGYTMIILPGPPASFTLPRLESLSIANVSFGDRFSIDDFISKRCLPVLETLVLIKVKFLESILLNISSLKLKHLRLESCKADSVVIQLDSPNLISLYFECSISKLWIIENLSSLVKADIDVTGAMGLAGILRKLYNVEELALSLHSLKISTEAPELFDNHSMLFLKLKRMKLECTVLSLKLFSVIAYLLNACPNIETLCLSVLHWWWYCNYKENASSPNQGDCWGTGLSLECLKFVEFRNVNTSVNELKFIEIC